MEKIILKTPASATAPAWYSQRVLPPELHVDQALFASLWDVHPKELGKVKMFGKIINTPRYQENYGVPYWYTGILHPANPIPHPFMQQLMDWVCADSACEYEQMIVNWYRDGKDYIGAHSDSTTGLVPDSAIYSFSFGQTRDFIVRPKTPSLTPTFTVKLTTNTVLVMGGSMQKYYTHEVPKQAHGLGRRINVTFRLTKPE